MQQTSPEQFLVAEASTRRQTDYRFRWGTYFGWTILSLGFYRYYGTAKLIERRTRHVARRLAFSSYLWHTLAARADAAGRRAEVQEGLDNLSRIHAQIESYDRANQRESTLWTILHLVLNLTIGVGFIIGFYVHHFLNADFRFLETWEGSFAQNVEWVMRRLGYEVQLPRRNEFGIEPVPKRSTGLYVVLSIITLGLFSIFWRYTAMADGNNHFDADDRMEDAILAGLGLTTGAYGWGAPAYAPPQPMMPPAASPPPSAQPAPPPAAYPPPAQMPPQTSSPTPPPSGPPSGQTPDNPAEPQP